MTISLPLDERERIAKRVLIFALPVLLAATVIVVVSAFFFAPERPRWGGYIVCVGAIVSALLGYRGKAQLGTACLIATLGLAMCVGMWVNGGVAAPIYLVSIPLAVLVCTVHGRYWTWAFLAVIGLLGIGCVYAESAGWIAPPPPFNPVLKVIIVMVFTAVAATFSIIPIDLLQRSRRTVERSNEDLKQFAYVAAHDLQEPTRMIQLYLQLIEHRLRGSVDADTQEYLAFVIVSANRMQGMVRSVLDFSTIGSDQKPFSRIDTHAALNQALANLAYDIRLSGALIEVKPLPKIVGSEPQIVRLFQNLVANAIKFRSASVPSIIISSESGVTGTIFSVSDNGIGIAEGSAEKLFGLFQRLHAQEEYPGEGIGLASCRKIMSLHDGRIWFEANRGSGTTFKFFIPDRTLL
jgi:signal transduction histidine kinase